MTNLQPTTATPCSPLPKERQPRAILVKIYIVWKWYIVIIIFCATALYNIWKTFAQERLFHHLYSLNIHSGWRPEGSQEHHCRDDESLCPSGAFFIIIIGHKVKFGFNSSQTLHRYSASALTVPSKTPLTLIWPILPASWSFGALWVFSACAQVYQARTFHLYIINRQQKFKRHQNFAVVVAVVLRLKCFMVAPYVVLLNVVLVIYIWQPATKR